MNKCYWFTGLPAAGKTTLARAVADRLPDSVVLDGDDLRMKLCADLGFSPRDRSENIRRVGHVAKLLWKAGHNVCCAFVSPYRGDRCWLRSIFPGGAFVEVWCATPREVCIERDPKGLWAEAERGVIEGFTGWDAPYEAPLGPEAMVYARGAEPAGKVARCIVGAYGHSFDEPHVVFIGRWSPFHNGHLAMIRAGTIREGRPALVLVRDSEEPFPIQQRCRMVELALEAAGIVGEVRCIPDIASVRYGRGVGYSVEPVSLGEEVAAVSGTQIREWRAAGDDRWREHVPPTTAAILDVESTTSEGESYD